MTKNGGGDTEQKQKQNNYRTDYHETGNKDIYKKEKLNISNASSIYCQNI
jgi:hypothetical protein